MKPSLTLNLKLFALPLSKQLPTSTKQPIFYLHAKKPTITSTAKLSLATKATNKAADFWFKLGQAPDNSWKRKAYTTGEKFMDRIEYEEWSLKAIDTELAPPSWSLGNGTEGGEDGKVTLLYPPSLLSPGPLLDSLKSQLNHREPHHKNAMYKCLVGAPLTFPFAIIPVVPNFPLFYVLWRAWSHWRAWKASRYLASLLTPSPTSTSNETQIILSPSTALDQVYSGASEGKEGLLLLTEDKVPLLIKEFALNEEEGMELRRAVGQARTRLEQREKEE